MPDASSTEPGPQQPTTALPDPQNWVDEFGSILFRYAMLRVSDQQTAEELVQETFLAALKSRDGFRGTSAPSTWFIAILKFEILDHFRRQEDKPSGSQPLENDPFVDGLFTFTLHYRIKPSAEPTAPSTDAENADFWRIFRRCLDGLPDNYRRAFMRVTVDGVNSGDACRELKVSATNLSVLLHRARSRQRPCLEKNWLKAAHGGKEDRAQI